MNSYELIKSRFQKRALTGVLAREITSYKTGGKIDLMVYPKTQEEIVWLFDILVKRNIDYFICGNATNILVSDDGFRGVFIKTDMLNKINTKDNEVSVDCGFNWDDMIEICVNKGLAGLEKTSYIPGTVGGAVKMNAGAFEQETFDKLISFSVLDIKNGDVKKIEKSNINYGYRKVEGIDECFIFNALFKFDYADINELKKIREEIINKRKIKQPLDYPSAGSVFKRPKNNYASKLIEECGLKGLRIGDAEVSTKHCGFIINKGNAKSSDIYNLILKIKEDVYKKTSIDLELEQIIVGKF